MAERVGRTAAPARLALGTGALSLAATVAAVVEAERAGCELALVGEGPLEVDAVVASAAALLATERIRVGPGVATVHDRHPVALARAAASLDRLAPGRALLGLGRGDRAVVEGRLGLGWRGSQAAIDDTLRICAALLGGEAVAHDGARWSAHLGPAPARASAGGPVPLYLAAVGRRTLRLGGALADGVILNYGASAAYVRWAVAEVAEGAAAAGRDPAEVDILGYVLIARADVDGAGTRVDAVRRALRAVLAEPDQGEALTAPDGGPPAELDRAALGRLAAVGDPAEIRGHLDSLRAAGLRCPVVLPGGLRALTGSSPGEAADPLL